LIKPLDKLVPATLAAWQLSFNHTRINRC